MLVAYIYIYVYYVRIYCSLRVTLIGYYYETISIVGFIYDRIEIFVYREIFSDVGLINVRSIDVYQYFVYYKFSLLIEYVVTLMVVITLFKRCYYYSFCSSSIIFVLEFVCLFFFFFFFVYQTNDSFESRSIQITFARYHYICSNVDVLFSFRNKYQLTALVELYDCIIKRSEILISIYTST